MKRTGMIMKTVCFAAALGCAVMLSQTVDAAVFIEGAAPSENVDEYAEKIF